MHFLSPRRARSTKPSPRLAHALCALMAVASLSACSYVPTIITPYKIDILQGNVVTREQSQLLKPGMTRPQVRDVLGSPLLTSVFHAERWDYVFTYRRQGQEPQRRKLTAFFKGDVLDRVESDDLPSEIEFVASLDSRRKPGKVLPLEATPEQLKAFQERNPGTPVTPPPTAPADANYPPLEGAP